MGLLCMRFRDDLIYGQQNYILTIAGTYECLCKLWAAYAALVFKDIPESTQNLLLQSFPQIESFLAFERIQQYREMSPDVFGEKSLSFTPQLSSLSSSVKKQLGNGN